MTANNPLQVLFAEFCSSGERDLELKLATEALTIPCIECGVEFSPDILLWLDGDPFCKEHYDEIVRRNYN